MLLLSLLPLSFRSFSPLRTVSLFVLCDDIVLLEDVIGRRLLLFKALLPRISVLLARMAGLPAVKIESPVDGFLGKALDKLRIKRLAANGEENKEEKKERKWTEKFPRKLNQLDNLISTKCIISSPPENGFRLLHTRC